MAKNPQNYPIIFFVLLILLVEPCSSNWFWGGTNPPTTTATTTTTQAPIKSAQLKVCSKQCKVSRQRSIYCHLAQCTEISDEIPHDARVIQLQDNSISNVPQLPFENLTSLDLSNNRISTLNDKAFIKLKHLQSLYLSNNRITSLNSDSFSNLGKLKYLHIDGNQLTVIPNDLFYPFLTSLEVLNLARNQISEIGSPGFSDVSTLRTLDLKKNNLTTINKDDFKFLGNLNELYLSYNKITKLEPLMFEDANSLKHLDLSHNMLNNITNSTFSLGFPSIHESQLTTLDLSHNNITHLEDMAFEGLNKLEVLNIGINLIKTLPPGILPKNLMQFHMSYMPNLETIQPKTFSGMTLLEHVEITNNKKLSTFLPFAFDVDFKNLRILDLHKNNLKTLSEKILLKWNSIEETVLSGNPWNCDCKLKWMKQVYMRPDDRESIRCATPSHLQGIQLVKVADEELLCGRFARLMRSQGRIGLVILIIVTLAFVVGIGSFLYRCRQRVFPCHYGQTSKYTALYNTNVPEDEEVQIQNSINVSEIEKKMLKEQANGELPEPVAL